MRIMVLCACLYLASFSLGQNVSPVPSIELPPTIDRILRDYESAWRARDAHALAALFDEQGFVLSPQHPPIHGRADIEKFYKESGGALTLRAFAFQADGNAGYIIGAYSAHGDGLDDGKFTLTLRKGAAERWLIVSDMDNGNTPRPPCSSK